VSGRLFEEGGPHNVRYIGNDQFEMRIKMPTDEDGLVGRECPNAICSPAYFKVKPGTGIAVNQDVAYCPYCMHAGEPSSFLTKAQLEYMKGVALQEAHRGVGRMLEKAFGLGPSRKKTLGGGLVKMELSYKPGPLPYVRPPIEAELRRDVTCPNCGLEHAVFGLATWCPDCGKDIFVVHVQKEFDVIRSVLGDVTRRREALGPRIAAHDVENALEDTVSIFEASIRAIVRRRLRADGLNEAAVEDIVSRRVGSRLQNPVLAAEFLNDQFGVDLFAPVPAHEKDQLCQIFEKRHPITHNLGIVDRKYLQKTGSVELEGRDVRVSSEDIFKVLGIGSKLIESLNSSLFRPLRE
jgi:hypothetical protein